MKKCMKLAMVMVAWVMCAAFLVGCAGSYGTWDEQWYSEHPMTQEAIIAQWGAPDKIISHDDGLQELIYFRKFPPSNEKTAFAYSVRNGQVTKWCWKEL